MATLKVSPSPPVEIGLEVEFEVVFPQPPLPGWNLQYRFDFGDDHTTNWAPERQAKHTYSLPVPRTYPVYAEIGVKYRDSVKPIRKIDNNVQVVPPSNPTPSATPSVPASPSPYSPSPTAIAPGGFITATPRGNGIASPTATLSPRKSSTVTPSSTLSDGKTSPIYYIIGAGVGVVLLAYLLYPRPKPNVAMAARPTFHPHSGWDAPQKPPENLTINYELHFQSNISSGQNWLQTHGQTLILRKTKQ